MKSRTKSIMAGLALAAIAIPGTIAASEPSDFASAELETEQQNLAWYTDLDTDAANNVSCREDLIEPVFVPEIEDRVVVKGEIIAIGLVTCADIELQSTDDIDGEMWVEVRHGANNWERIGIDQRVSGEMLRGVGYDEAAIDHVFGANDPNVTKPLRVCIQTFQPDPSEVLCKTAKTALASVAVAPLQ